MKRNYGLDIARIFFMFSVLVLHVIKVSQYLENYNDNLTLSISLQLINIYLFCTVDVFGILTGFLLVQKQSYKSRRVIYLLFSTFFYSIIISFIFMFFKPEVFNSYDVYLDAFLPVRQSTYWYIFNYIPLALASPYINMFINKLGKKRFKSLLIFIIVFFSFIPSLLGIDIFAFNYGFSFVWLLCCYLIGAYIKLHIKPSSARCYKLKLFGVSLILCLIVFLVNYCATPIFHEYVMYFLSYYSPCMLGIGICLFLIFYNTQVKHCKKIIKFLSINSFDVYIIHSHTLIYTTLIGQVLFITSNNNTALTLLVMFSTLVAVYLFCCVMCVIKNLIFKFTKLNVLINFLGKKLDTFLYSKL